MVCHWVGPSLLALPPSFPLFVPVMNMDVIVDVPTTNGNDSMNSAVSIGGLALPQHLVLYGKNGGFVFLLHRTDAKNFLHV